MIQKSQRDIEGEEPSQRIDKTQLQDLLYNNNNHDRVETKAIQWKNYFPNK